MPFVSALTEAAELFDLALSLRSESVMTDGHADRVDRQSFFLSSSPGISTHPSPSLRTVFSPTRTAQRAQM